MNLNDELSDSSQVHWLRDFQSDLRPHQHNLQPIPHLTDYGEDRKDLHNKLSRVHSPSHLLPKLPHSPGLGDINNISPQPRADLRSSRYPVIPPLTPPDDRNAPREIASPPYFQHSSYDSFDDNHAKTSKKGRMYQRQQHNNFSFHEDQHLETFRFRDARNPLHDVLDNGSFHHSSPVASQHNRAQAKIFELCTRESSADILKEITNEMIRDIAQDVSTMAQRRLWNIYSEDARYYYPCLTSLQDNVLNEELRAIVKEVIKEMVTDYFKFRVPPSKPSEKQEMTVTSENVSGILTEALNSEVSEEVYKDLFSAQVLNVVEELMRSGGILEAVFQSNNKQISQLTTDMIIDGLQLDHLLEKLANHRHVWNDSEVKDMLMDNILGSEFTQLFHLMSAEGQRSCNVLPLKRFHENTTTDCAVDFLLNELTATLDEDLDDLLEYENAQEITARKYIDRTR
ncbi:uncharacterized protein LOC117121678 isoform X2 [Anneissia japonica]|uniref:uncharacterized protein LOC117121678 isoform X2 n=1 Tax=Anneissia japonica TaxID=1529436 RepID=UPI0014257850|nr:uncharacterized protein LOC117121678 isoform X2 [Anneissia japonica]